MTRYHAGVIVDTHCHLTHPRLAADLDETIERAREAGLVGCITIGTGCADAEACLAVVDRFAGFVEASAGIDPFTAHRVGEAFDDEFERLCELLDGGRFVALGEVGLDYHYELQPRARQAADFERQLAAAAARDLPVVIHVREAHEDMAAILAAHPDNRGVIHSFTGGPGEAARYLELDWYLAFNGVATFKGAPEVREAARACPRERLLVETDSPYLAPVPHRGKRCEPAFTARTLEVLAGERGEEPAELARVSTENARRLFGDRVGR